MAGLDHRQIIPDYFHGLAPDLRASGRSNEQQAEPERLQQRADGSFASGIWDPEKGRQVSKGV